MNVQEKFQRMQQDLNQTLLEREDEISVVLTALLAGENVVLVGPPGTAKSMMCDAVVQWIDGNKFEALISKTTEPMELFGPPSISAFKQDRHETLTAGYLPEAHVAFLDELFKGSSAILNTTLKVLNEHKYKNGVNIVSCPLVMAIAASNEWPTEAKELGALFDRFLFRKAVKSVAGEDSIEKLIFAPTSISLSTQLTIAELKSAQVDIRQNMTFGEEANSAFHEIRRKLRQEGIIIGDRRLQKSAHAVKCFAWLQGSPWVSTDDLAILAHIWWVSPESQPQVVADVIADVAKPSSLMCAMLLGQAMEVNATVKLDDLLNCATVAKKLMDIHGQLGKDAKSMAVRARIAQMIHEIRNANVV